MNGSDSVNVTHQRRRRYHDRQQLVPMLLILLLRRHRSLAFEEKRTGQTSTDQAKVGIVVWSSPLLSLVYLLQLYFFILITVVVTATPKNTVISHPITLVDSCFTGGAVAIAVVLVAACEHSRVSSKESTFVQRTVVTILVAKSTSSSNVTDNNGDGLTVHCMDDCRVMEGGGAEKWPPSPLAPMSLDGLRPTVTPTASDNECRGPGGEDMTVAVDKLAHDILICPRCRYRLLSESLVDVHPNHCLYRHHRH